MNKDQTELLEQITQYNKQYELVDLDDPNASGVEAVEQLREISKRLKSPSMIQRFAALVPILSELPKSAVTFWEFGKAPEVFQTLTHCDGDEDWLAYVPPDIAKQDEYSNRVLALIMHRKNIDYSLVEVQLPDGSKLFRGAH